MKLGRFEYQGETKLGLIHQSGIIDISAHDQTIPKQMLQLIDNWDQFKPALSKFESKAPDLPFDDVQLLSPIERPEKILGIGLNYADHIAEANVAAPTDQVWFTKLSSSLNGPFDDIELPIASSHLDYEGELVSVLKPTAKHLSSAEARDAIFGYCVGNDVSVRDWQVRTSQFILGKSFDTHAPIGPWIVTSDEFDPHSAAIQTRVNGELRQNSNTRHLIFNCFDQVSYLSQAISLKAGDLLFTGTPGGVGAAMSPPKWLGAGDVVEVHVEGIGAIRNRVASEIDRRTKGSI